MRPCEKKVIRNDGIIIEIFSKAQYVRLESRCLHKLTDVLFMAFCTLLSNGNDFEDIVEFGHQRRKYLEDLLELINNIYSENAFNNILQLVDPE